MPFAEKDVDFNQIRFYHRGDFTLETELGPLDVKEGDFVVVPKGLVFRERPLNADGNAIFIFEVDAAVLLAEQLWDSVGFSSFLTDFSTMVIPEPDSTPTTRWRSRPKSGSATAASTTPSRTTSIRAKTSSAGSEIR